MSIKRLFCQINISKKSFHLGEVFHLFIYFIFFSIKNCGVKSFHSKIRIIRINFWGKIMKMAYYKTKLIIHWRKKENQFKKALFNGKMIERQPSQDNKFNAIQKLVVNTENVYVWKN